MLLLLGLISFDEVNAIDGVVVVAALVVLAVVVVLLFRIFIRNQQSTIAVNSAVFPVAG